MYWLHLYHRYVQVESHELGFLLCILWYYKVYGGNVFKAVSDAYVGVR